MQLLFPLLCLVIGLLTDAMAKKLKGVPASVLQLFFTCMITVLMEKLLDEVVVTQVLNNWTWINIDPHVLMVVLLPILIFESAFKLEVHTFLSNMKLIGCLASICFFFAMIMQAGLTGLLHTQFLEMEQRWSVITTFTFASIISATDPVAVVSILGALGAPTRLKVLVEGESLCNDGAAVLAVSFLEVAILSDHHKIDVHWPTEIPVRLLGLCLTFPIGIIAALICALVMRHIEDGRIQQASVVIGVFAVWIAAEDLQGSGVVGVVCMGLGLRYNRDSMRHHACEECEALWELLAMWANYVIFIMSGIVVGDVMAKFDMQGSEIMLGILVYGATVVSRAMALIPIFLVSWIRHPGDLPEVKYFTIMTWGGLRGAVGLLLAMHISTVLYEVGEHEHGERVLYYTAITVLLSLAVQATTTEPIVKKLKLNVKAMRVAQDCKRLERQLNDKKRKFMEKMSLDLKNFYLGGVNWRTVGAVTRFKFGHHEANKPGKTPSKTPSGTPSSHSPAAAASESDSNKAELISFQEIEDESRQNYLTMLQKRAWKQWKDGILSRNTISHLDTVLEGVRDKLYKVEALTEEESTRGTIILLVRCLEATPSPLSYRLACCLQKYIEPLCNRPKNRLYQRTRSYDWWQVVSTLIVILQFYLAYQMYFSPPTREYVMFFIMLSCCGCILEQIILIPFYFKHWKMHFHKDHGAEGPSMFFLAYTAIELMYLVYYIMWAAFAGYAISSFTHQSDQCIHRERLHHDEYRVSFLDEGVCYTIFWFPLGVTLRFSFKFLISVCFLIDAFSEAWLEKVKARYMLNLASLYTLIHISDEICSRTLLESYNRKVAWRIWDLNGTLKEKLEETLVCHLNNKAMLYMSNLVKTRQAARTVMRRLMLAADELASCGLISDPSRELIEEEMEHVEHNISLLTLKAPEANAREEMQLVSWINQATDDMRFHGRSPELLVTFLYKYIRPPMANENEIAPEYEEPFVWLEPGYVFFQDDDIQDCIFFICEGMVQVMERDVGEPGLFVYPGNWIGTQALIAGSNKRKRNAKAVAATPVKACKLGAWGIADLWQFDPVLEKRVILEEVILKAKNLAQGVIEDLRMVNDQALLKYIQEELLIQLSADYTVKMPIPEGVKLVLLHGQVLMPAAQQWLCVHVCDEDMLDLPKQELVVKPLAVGDQAYIVRLELPERANSGQTPPFSASASAATLSRTPS